MFSGETQAHKKSGSARVQKGGSRNKAADSSYQDREGYVRLEVIGSI